MLTYRASVHQVDALVPRQGGICKTILAENQPVPNAPNSFSMTATFFPWLAVRTGLIKVVLPDPKNPVTIVTGTLDLFSCLYAMKQHDYFGGRLDGPCCNGEHRVGSVLNWLADDCISSDWLIDDCRNSISLVDDFTNSDWLVDDCTEFIGNDFNGGGWIVLVEVVIRRPP